MNSLFWKILGWFVGTAVLTTAGLVVVTYVATPRLILENPWPGKAVTFLTAEAVQRREAGDLSQFLSRLRESAEIDAHLLDAQGRDVVTHEDFSRQYRRLERSRFLPVVFEGKLLVGRRAEGEGAFVMVLPRAYGQRRLLLPQHLWIGGCLVLLSYLLARHFTRPIRQLEQAAELLGRGDLSARVRLQRNDETGRLAVAFNRMADRIQALLESQQRLLADVSHELRSPLTRLGVAVELARESESPERELNVIQQQADRLNALVGSLLHFSRAEMNPSSLRHEPVDLAALIDALMEDCTLDAQAAGCRLERTGDRQAQLLGDAELLRRALENVVRNAIRHAPVDTAVEIQLAVEGRRARIVIRDHGPGVSEEAIGRIFDPFYREASAHTGGAGLGLSIARRAIDLHGGRIQAANAHPGLRVTIDLPATQRAS